MHHFFWNDEALTRQKVDRALLHRSKFQVAARFLDAEDHTVARIGRALRRDRGDGPCSARK
jgi:hypothetical protein